MKKCGSESGFDMLFHLGAFSLGGEEGGPHLHSECLQSDIGEQCAVTRGDRYIEWATI